MKTISRLIRRYILAAFAIVLLVLTVNGALLATISLTPKQLEKSVLLSGSDLSYNERTIGLTVHCKSFHARTANCEPTLPLQRSIYAG